MTAQILPRPYELKRLLPVSNVPMRQKIGNLVCVPSDMPVLVVDFWHPDATWLTAFSRPATRTEVQEAFRIQTKADEFMALVPHKFTVDAQFEAAGGNARARDATYVFFADHPKQKLTVEDTNKLALACCEPASKFSVLGDTMYKTVVNIVKRRAKALFEEWEEEEKEPWRPLDVFKPSFLAVLPSGSMNCWFAKLVVEPVKRNVTWFGLLPHATVNVIWYEWCEDTKAFVDTKTGFQHLPIREVVGALERLPTSKEECVALDNAVLAKKKT